jgi:hypothetical protein
LSDVCLVSSLPVAATGGSATAVSGVTSVCGSRWVVAHPAVLLHTPLQLAC